MKKISIERIRDNGVQTLGRGRIFDDEITPFKWDFVTLEPSWVLNEPFISCIALGSYPLTKRQSHKFGNHFEVLNVFDREYILIHTLNTYRQTEGCIGAGRRFTYLDGDSHYDITNSADTLREMWQILPDETTIEITHHEQFQRLY